MTNDQTSPRSKIQNPKLVDPENTLLWRQNLRRLEAEVIRDSMLAVSGTLDPTLYGPGTLDEGHTRRSIYFMVKRRQPTFVKATPATSAAGGFVEA